MGIVFERCFDPVLNAVFDTVLTLFFTCFIAVLTLFQRCFIAV